jgi:hypothetical protein
VSGVARVGCGRLRLARIYGRLYGRPWRSAFPGPLAIGPQYSAHMPISADELRALGARVRAEAEAAGEMAKPGPSHWVIPQAARDALLEYLHSGAYEEAARACIADEPEF